MTPEILKERLKDKETIAALFILAKWLSTMMLAAGYGILVYYLLKGKLPFG